MTDFRHPTMRLQSDRDQLEAGDDDEQAQSNLEACRTLCRRRSHWPVGNDPCVCCDARCRGCAAVPPAWLADSLAGRPDLEGLERATLDACRRARLAYPRSW